jgi:hypothetical protein
MAVPSPWLAAVVPPWPRVTVQVVVPAPAVTRIHSESTRTVQGAVAGNPRALVTLISGSEASSASVIVVAATVTEAPS